MSIVPKTSTTLLRTLATNVQHERWRELIARYRPMLEAYMREHFANVETEDIIQDTFVALMKALPGYSYVPDEKGAFHNYLTGILRHKVLKKIAKDKKRNEAYAKFSKSIVIIDENEKIEKIWRNSLLETALQQFLADDSVQERTKQVFVRVAVNGEKPEAVAAAFGISRNNVDQIKARSLLRLRDFVNALEAADESALKS